MVASATLMNPLMTRYAERHQIVLIMRATIGERLDMMHERREDVSTPLLAALAKWMRCQVSIANPAPCSAVSLVLIVAAREILVVSLHDFLVCLTVTALSICEIRTACHAAGTFRLSRHCTSPSKKPSRRIASPRRLNQFSIFAECIISHRSY